MHQHTGASQTQIATACGTDSGQDQRASYGESSRSKPWPCSSASPRHWTCPIRHAPSWALPRSARPASAADRHGCSQPRPLSLDPGDRQEEQDPVRRRTFVGLTGATMFSAMLAGPHRRRHAHGRRATRARARRAHRRRNTPASSTAPPDLAALTAAVNRARSQYQACHYTELIKLPAQPARAAARGLPRARRRGPAPRPRAVRRRASRRRRAVAQARRPGPGLPGSRPQHARRPGQRRPRHGRGQCPDHHPHPDERAPPRRRHLHRQHARRPAGPRDRRPHPRIPVGLRVAAAARRDRRRPARQPRHRPRAAHRSRGRRTTARRGRQPALDRLRPDQRHAAPGQHRRHARRRGNRGRCGPQHRPEHDHRPRAEGQPAHRHRPRVPPVGQARQGIHRPARSRADRA